MKWTSDQNVNVTSFLAKLREAEKHINKNYKVKELSHGFPSRVKKLIKQKGRRLRKE